MFLMRPCWNGSLSAAASLVKYYHTLLDYYEPWYQNYNYSPKMRIDGDKYDFVENPKDREIVLGMIEEKLREMGKL